ncbi:transglutaminase domain-containing protein [Nonomuraea sp. NPDC004297]
MTGSTAATPILDWRHPLVQELSAEAHGSERALLTAAHRLITTRVRPVYAMNEKQPASTTLRLGRGSCSQRLALLEAVARARGIPTRVRGLLLDGRFWQPRRNPTFRAAQG